MPDSMTNDQRPLKVVPKSKFPLLLAVGCALMLGISMVVNLVLFGAVGALASDAQVDPYEVVEQGESDDRVAIIDISGPITDRPEEGLMGALPSLQDQAVTAIRRVAEDERFVGVILHIDSPGGGVTASDVIHHEVQQLRAAGKKVVVHMGDLCASGGYYIAVAADHLIASPTTITGSIGVILGLVDASLLADKVGVRFQPLTSGDMKGSGSPWEPMDPQAREMFQGIVDALYERFLALVVDGRTGHGPLPDDQMTTRELLAPLADGRIFTAQQALEAGLVDAVGYSSDAIAAIREAVGSDATVVRYRKPQGLFGFLQAKHPDPLKDVDLPLPDRRVRFQYLWRP